MVVEYHEDPQTGRFGVGGSIESNSPKDIESQIRTPTTQDAGNLLSKVSNNLISQNRGFSTLSRSLSRDLNEDPATFWPKAYLSPDLFPKTEVGSERLFALVTARGTIDSMKI